MIMKKRERRKVKVTVTNDASQYGNITNEKLLADSELFDKETYNPLDNIDDKEIIVPAQKTEIITVRFSTSENNMITEAANELGLSKSSYIRSIVKETLNRTDNCLLESKRNINNPTLDELLSRLKNLESKTAKLEDIDFKLAYLISNMKHQDTNPTKPEYYDFMLDKPSYLRRKAYGNETSTIQTFKGVRPCQ